MGERLAHGTPFRCAWEDGLLDNSRVVQVGSGSLVDPTWWQVGLRGTGWSHGDLGWGREQVGRGVDGAPVQGWRVVQAEECWHKSMEPLMAEIREMMGQVGN